MSDEALGEVARQGRVVHHPAGSLVHEANVPLTTIGFVLRGRLKAVRVDARGTESLFRMIERGEQYGLMVGALAEPVPVRVVALEPTTVLVLDYEQAMELTLAQPDLRRLWLKTYAGSLRKLFFGSTSKRAPMMLALIHESPSTRRAAERLLARLREVGESLAVFSDSAEWRGLPGVRSRALHADGRMLEPDEIRRQGAEWQDANRIVFDVHVDLEPELAGRLMQLVDRAIYFVPAAASEAAVRRLQALDVPARGWRDKISVAWILQGDNPVAPVVPALRDLVARDFKIAETQPQRPGAGRWPMVWSGWSTTFAASASAWRWGAGRPRHVSPGRAQGTGAERHRGGHDRRDECRRDDRNRLRLRPRKRLQRNPVCRRPQAVVDLPQSAPRRPPYLLYKYRRGHFDPMLRKYLHDWRLEQLAVPCLSVTVDLVGGSSVVRERGDATHAILESINLPVLSIPIIREGQALIDGGLVNNIPADVLVSMGCNFVIAVSVTAKMEKEFCKITAGAPAPPRRNPGVVQTLLRSLVVQNRNMNAIGVQPADVVIEPDVTGFELTAFLLSKEMAAVGEAATNEQIPRIKQLLARLDPQLFPLDGGTPRSQK